jgi:acetyl-CoA carboxylase biotin carboxyl carrier protein
MATVVSPVTGTVWKLEVSLGDDVQEGDELMILESMKMEIPVEAEDDGQVKAILCEEGDSIAEGQPLVELG